MTAATKILDLHDRGCEAAARYLTRHGHKVIDVHVEGDAEYVDIVARDGYIVVFAKVMISQTHLPDEGDLELARVRFEQAAAAYLKTLDVVDVPVRFDIICMHLLDTSRVLFRHHINACGHDNSDAQAA